MRWQIKREIGEGLEIWIDLFVRNFLQIFPFVGHINFEGDRRRCTENISRRQCHGSSRIPSSAIPKMDKPRRGIRSRASDLPRRTCTRNLSENVGGEWGRKREGDVCVLHLTYPAFYIRSVEKSGGGRGDESRHTRKGNLRGVEFYFPPGIIF